MTLTPHGHTYVVPPPEERVGIALCLSGGGFRAALFHLGALRRLYEIGMLQRVDTITAVSGGTLAAAQLAAHAAEWRDRPISPAWWEAQIAAPFRAFTSRNLSAWPVLKGLLHPWTNTGVRALADRIERRLTAVCLDDLPAAPAFKFCASDLVSGANYILDRDGSADLTGGDRRVALASAISACHPVFLRPFTTDRPQRISLVDGGIYDDRGVEPVWRTHRTLLVSDGGDVLRPQRADSVLWPLFRSAAVIWDRYQVVQRRWLIDRLNNDPLGGAYWSIGGAVSHFADGEQPTGYSAALARDTIATIRTDYDAFSDAEAAVLENHGYLLAAAAADRHLRTLGVTYPSLRVPHPAWLPDRLVRDALRTSWRKRLFGRGFLDFDGDAAPVAGAPADAPAPAATSARPSRP